jgi:hypothetical protein
MVAVATHDRMSALIHKGKVTFWRDLAETWGPFLNFLGGSLDFRKERVDVVEPWKRALEMIESESRALVQTETPSTPKSETDLEIAPLVQNLGTTSIAEIEKMIAELQEARDFLQAEGERVQREAEHYSTLTQMASASVKIISDTVAGWREAGHPLRNDWRSSQFDVMPSLTEDNNGSVRVPDQQSPQSQGQIRARTRRKELLK